ncbi:MAG: transcriptional repressor [Anaerolineales bacterium]|nr:transcriptional repressor [Anaerolineae bacterium]PWB77326.1 MAG: transcriptional repressor [Anaerolineales bacterium]
MSCSSEYVPQLRALGYRMTPQRMAILHVLRHEGTHLSPAEVYKKALLELPGLTEPTVYRTLEFLADLGLARPAYATNGRLTYEIAGNDHHHLVCKHCGDEIEVEHTLLESLYRLLETTSGYRSIGSHVTFFGICPKCQKN